MDAQPDQRSLRWGVLSTADIARRKVIPGLRKAARCSVVAIASRDGARARAVAAELDIPTAYGSYEALLAADDIDAVYIPLPNHLHAEWTIAAARAGKHVLCEKPLAMTAAEADRDGRRVRARGRPADGGLHVSPASVVGRRARPRRVRPDRASRRGRQLVLVLQRRPDQHPQHRGIRWRRPVRHRLLQREPVPDAVRRRAASVSTPGSCAIRRPASTCSRARSSRSTPASATFTCSTRAEPDQRVDIYGTEGRLRVHIPFNVPPDRPTEITLTAGGDPPVAPDSEVLRFAIADPYTVEAERFAAAILDDLATPTPPEDAIANLRVIERIFAAGDADGAI